MAIMQNIVIHPRNSDLAYCQKYALKNAQTTNTEIEYRTPYYNTPIIGIKDSVSFRYYHGGVHTSQSLQP